MESAASVRSDGYEGVVLPGLDALGLFVFLLAATYLPQEAVTIICAAAVALYLLKRGFRVRLPMLRLLALPSVLLFMGLGGFFRNATGDVLRDGWYFLTAVVVLAAGYALGDWGMGLKRALRVFLLAAAVSAAVHICYMLAFAGPELLTLPVDAIRMKYGRGSFFPVVGAFIAFYCIRRDAGLFGRGKAVEAAALVLCLAALVLTFSRSFWICLFALALVAAADFRRPVRSAALTVLAVAVLASALFALTLRESTGRTFLGKTAGSLTEAAPAAYSTEREISRHWRGYETFMTLAAIASGDASDVAFGQGFGRLVDLGLYMDMGGEVMRYVSRVHNGYLFVMLKDGLAGAAVYFGFFLWLAVKGARIAKGSVYLDMPARALAGMGVVFLIISFANAGLYNKGGMFAPILFLGAMFAAVSTGRGLMTRRETWR